MQGSTVYRHLPYVSQGVPGMAGPGSAATCCVGTVKPSVLSQRGSHGFTHLALLREWALLSTWNPHRVLALSHWDLNPQVQALVKCKHTCSCRNTDTRAPPFPGNGMWKIGKDLAHCNSGSWVLAHTSVLRGAQALLSCFRFLH